MSAYYNEFDPFAAAWLRELIKAGLIADGEVDERSIKDVTGADTRGFTQVHFFAGIGGWSYALRRAGFPDDRPCCTASLPCQPYSVGSVGHGGARHERKRLHWMAYARGEGRPGYQPLQRLLVAAPSSQPQHGDALVRAGAALDGDFGSLLPCNGLSVVMERSALKGYGNAINPELAAEFIKAAMT